MSPRVLTISTLSLSMISLTVAGPAHSVTKGQSAGNGGISLPKNARAINVDLSGISVSQTVRVVGPYKLDKKFRVRGDFAVVVKQPGTYRLHFTDVRQGEWRYPSSYVRTVVVPKKPATQQVRLRYQRARLRFDGVGKLRAGMTFEQAVKADPSVRAELDFGCVQASSRYADLFFNPPASGGKLAMIMAKPGIRTTAGVRLGSSYRKAKRAYGFTRTTADSRKWDYIRVSPNYRGRGGKEATRQPYLGVEFESGPQKNSREFWITRSTVSNLFVDAGQRCVN